MMFNRVFLHPQEGLLYTGNEPEDTEVKQAVMELLQVMGWDWTSPEIFSLSIHLKERVV